MTKAFKLPELGEEITAGDVTRLLVSEGERVEADQPAVEVETGKATVEVPCPIAGVVRNVQVQEGDTVKIGAVLFEVEEEAGAAVSSSEEDTPEAAAADEPAPSPAAEPDRAEDTGEGDATGRTDPPASEPAPASNRRTGRAKTAGGDVPAVGASPSVRRLARELGIDLHLVAGSGGGGRITEDDLRAHADGEAAGASVAAEGAPAGQGTLRREKMKTIRRKTAEHMARSWQIVPHVTQFEDIDITELEAFRKRFRDEATAMGVKLTPTALVLPAVVGALKRFPAFNASLDADSSEIVYREYYNIGVAVDTDRGLLVPVIRDADRKDLFCLAQELGDLAVRAREGKLLPDELRGGTFTVSNLGGIGGTGFTPIINYPEVAILGISRSRLEPRYVDGELQPRLIMPICISYDHRVIDGAEGARFAATLAASLSDPQRLLLGL